MRPRRLLTAAFWIVAAGCWLLPASGCASANARSASDAPPLAMPPPPPRLEPIESEPAPPPPPPAPVEDSRPPPSTRKPANPPARPDPNKPDPNKQEPPPPPADAHKPVEEPARSAPTLQTTPAGAEGEVERTIRSILQRARSDLNRVDYKRLNAEARTQYDTAKRFVTQAEDALRAKNLVFAKTVADKAAGLAAQLAGK